MGVPLRSFLANLINCFASIRATWRYLLAKRDKRKLVWQKTEHAYPAHAALAQQRRDFEEILVDSRLYFERGVWQPPVQRMPSDANLGQYLFVRGLLVGRGSLPGTAVSSPERRLGDSIPER